MKITTEINNDVLVIPVQLFDFFSETQYIMTTGIGNCVLVMKRESWEELSDILDTLSDGITTRKIQRLFMSTAMEVSVEKKQVLLPNYYSSCFGGRKAEVQIYYDERVSLNVVLIQKSSNSSKETEEYKRNICILQRLQQQSDRFFLGY